MNGKKSNVVWIDVGTHIGQEVMAAVGPIWPILVTFTRRFLSAHILRRGVPYSLTSLCFILKRRARLARLANFQTIVVEANIGLFDHPVYKFADQAFCLALGKAEETGLAKLYFVNGEKEGQGSSIFKTKKQTASNSYILAPLMDPEIFFHGLKRVLDQQYAGSDYHLVLRLNCEGTESEVIRECYHAFADRILLVMGSLKDVAEIKGDSDLVSLNHFLASNKMRFVPFTSMWETWSSALDAITLKLRR
jgi:hypothetical protein